MPKRSLQRGTVELHSGKWSLRFNEKTADGRWKTRRITLEGCSSEREARRAADRFFIEREGVTAPAITLREFHDTLWMAFVRHRRLRASTFSNYEGLWRRHLDPHLGRLRMTEITKRRLTEFFDKLTEEGVSATTQARLYTVLRTMMGVALDHDLIAQMPLSPRLHRPRNAAQPKPILTPGEIRRIIECADAEYRPALILLASTGLRIGELLALRWEDVDFESGEMRVERCVWRKQIGPPKSDRSRRTVHLQPAIIEVLREHHARSRFNAPTDVLFPDREGRPMWHAVAYRKILEPALKRAGIKRGAYTHGFHCFRHTLASIVYAQTRDAKFVQTLLGHADIRTTMAVYVHSLTEVVSSAIGAELVGVKENQANEPIFIN